MILMISKANELAMVQYPTSFENSYAPKIRSTSLFIQEFRECGLHGFGPGGIALFVGVRAVGDEVLLESAAVEKCRVDVQLRSSGTR